MSDEMISGVAAWVLWAGMIIPTRKIPKANDIRDFIRHLIQ